MDNLVRENLEYLVNENFQFYKATGILVSLLLIVSFQSLYPNRLAFQNLLSNWKVNVPIALINTILVSLLCGACVCTWAITIRENNIGFFEIARFPYWFEVVTTVFLLDFVAWIWHRANHVSSFLWRFHSVHHSDTRFEASTAFRFHPGEILISLGIRLLVVTLTGLPIIGLIAFEIIYGFFNLLVHSDIRISKHFEKLLGLIFVTPSLHRLHHSVVQKEHNHNYGTILSFWDRLARTYLYANADSRVTLGLPGERTKALKLKDALTLPLRPD